MKDKLLEWLSNEQNKQLDFSSERNRLTINPKNNFISIKYWEPKQIKGTDTYFWWSTSEIRITSDFLKDCTNYIELAEFIFQKLLEGGDHEVNPY